MKSHNNRKPYNFTKRQWQRAKSERLGRYDKVGAEFNKIRQRHFRAKCRHTLIQLIQGKDVEFTRFRKTDSWDW